MQCFSKCIHLLGKNPPKTKPIYPTVHYSIILSACHIGRHLHFGPVPIFKALSADTDDVTVLSCMMHR